MDTATPLAVLTALGALAAALASAVVVVLNARARNNRDASAAAHELQQQRDSAAVVEYRNIVEELKEQLDRLQKHIDQQQAMLLELHDEHTSCQVEMEALWVWVQRFHDLAQQLARNQRRSGGGEQIEVWPLPPRRPRPAGDAGFRLRTMQQGTELLKEVDRRLKHAGADAGTSGRPAEPGSAAGPDNSALTAGEEST